MAWIRQLDENSAGERLWAATVYIKPGPGGRLTETHRSKKIVENWAKEQETALARGNWIDPRLGKKTVGEIWELYGEGRKLEKASRKRDGSHWNVWVGPRWADVEIGRILKPDVTAWVTGLERRTGAEAVGGWTIIASLALLRSLLEIAVDARLIHFNPARGVRAPKPPKHVDRMLTDDEYELLLANLDARFPGLPEARLFVEVLAETGPRYEELAALRHTPEAVDKRGHVVSYRPVLEKDGTIREHPKSDAGDRAVPFFSDDLWRRFRDHLLTVPPGGLVFTAPGGGALLYDNWLKRVWNKGLLAERPMTDAEKEAWKAARLAEGKRPWRARWVVHAALLADPQPTPHDMRHLFGTRLSEAGVPAHERRALMGHEDQRSQKRYENFRPGRFDAVREAMKRRRTN